VFPLQLAQPALGAVDAHVLRSKAVVSCQRPETDDRRREPKRVYSCSTSRLITTYTVELGKTKLGTLPPLVLGGIIENQNSDFVMA
jgi:hypothetical protein